ncbi:MAG TPA: cation:proton antiporter [Nocardioidaceae bacterium]
MSADAIYLLFGGALLLAVVLPTALSRAAVSAPIVLLVVGALMGLPLPEGTDVTPLGNLTFVEHLTEFTVIIALMGVGLALDRPLDLRRFASWRKWSAAWRLLGISMPLTIAGVALLGWWVVGLAPAAALLLGAALAPTDPVLAGEVQVEGPTPAGEMTHDEIDESDEVRFALTSEAGLNDGMAFPFVYAAIFLVTIGPVTEWGLRWVGWELLGRVVLGVLLGLVVGWALAKAAFRAPARSLRLAEAGEPLLALAAVFLSYGVAEVVGGYGFLAVFACAMTLRSAERGHEYHAHMHAIIERLERLLTLAVLLLLGVSMTNGLVANLPWQAAVVSVLLVFAVRPAAGMLGLGFRRKTCRIGDHVLTSGERLAISFFGVRGVGSLYYLAYATRTADVPDAQVLWSTVAFTIALSVLVHGVTATPVMRWLERSREI